MFGKNKFGKAKLAKTRLDSTPQESNTKTPNVNRIILKQKIPFVRSIRE